MIKPPVFRIFFCIIAAGLIGFGGFLIAGGIIVWHEININKSKLAMDIAVDLSKPGEYKTTFDQTWDICHGQTVDIYMSQENISQLTRDKLLEAMEFNWQIIDNTGKIIAQGSSEDKYLHDYSNENCITLMYFNPIRKGEYEFQLSIIQGNPQLAGIEQRLKSSYHPCGLEMLLSVMLLTIGSASLLIGVIIIWLVVIYTKRSRKRAVIETGSKCQDN